MNVIEYVKANWKTLPKSDFDGESVVVVKELEHYDGGFGHHSYEGFGVLENGTPVWCFSSGCSCNGSVDVDHSDEKHVKVLELLTKFEDINPKDIDFQSLEVSFQSY